jgi:hypothetical protein
VSSGTLVNSRSVLSKIPKTLLSQFNVDNRDFIGVASRKKDSFLCGNSRARQEFGAKVIEESGSQEEFPRKKLRLARVQVDQPGS